MAAGSFSMAAGALWAVTLLVVIGQSQYTGVEATCNAATEYACSYQNRCILNNKLDNGVNDCGDNSDEVNVTCPKADHFRCSSGACVPISYHNDGDPDCADRVDERKIVGQFCNTSWCCPCEDFVNNSFCDTSNSQCKCLDGHYSNSLLTNCIARVLYDSCAVSIDCSTVSNGMCNGTHCVCAWGYYDDNDLCVQRVLYDTCRVDADCTTVPNSVCNGTTCVCDAGRYDSNSTCVDRIIGDSCSTNLDCYPVVPYSSCRSSQCACNDGYYVTNSNTECTARVLGDPCTTNTDCTGVMEGSICSNGKCECDPDWFIFANQTGCWHKNLGDDCTRDGLCTAGIANAYCDPNLNCNCTAGWIQVTGRVDLCRNRILGVDGCATDADCGITNSNCNSAYVCACNAGYYSNSDKTSCVLRLIDDPCTSNADCSAVANANCGSSSLCACNTGFKVNAAKNQCSVLQVGDACTTNVDCTTAFLYSYCTPSKVCACQSGYVTTTSGGNTVCRIRYLGIDSCSTNTDCTASIANSSCVNGLCSCDAGFTASNQSQSECYLNDFTALVCSVDSDCAAYAGSACISGLCGCPAGYTVGNMRCNRRGIGDTCTSVTECTAAIGNSTCDGTSGTCVCLMGYVRETQIVCRRRILGVDSCVVDADCGVSDTLCAANNTCLCGPGYETTPDKTFCLGSDASTAAECTDFVSCKPWAIGLIIVALLLPPLITGVVMLTYKNIQDRKNRLSKTKKEKYGKSDPYRDLGMAAIPTITNFTAPHDTALHNLPEIGADWSLDNDDTYFTSTPKGAAGLVIRDKSFFRDITSITSKMGSKDNLMSKVDI